MSREYVSGGDGYAPRDLDADGGLDFREVAAADHSPLPETPREMGPLSVTVTVTVTDTDTDTDTDTSMVPPAPSRAGLGFTAIGPSHPVDRPVGNTDGLLAVAAE